MKHRFETVFLALLVSVCFNASMGVSASIPQPITSHPSTAVSAQLARLTRQVNELKEWKSCFIQILPITTEPDQDGKTIWLALGDQSNSVFVPTLKENCVQ